MTWVFQPADALTVKRWSERGTRDAEKSLLFASLMYGQDGTAMRNPDYNKIKNAIEVVNDFQGKSGDRVTIPNAQIVTGRGTHNDKLLRGSGAAQGLDSMDLFYENIAHQIISGGKLSERRIALDFRKTSRQSLTDWYRRKVEESIILALWGLTSWYGTPLKNFNNSGETQSMLNTIQPFDGNHTVYAGNGDATSDATLTSPDRMSAQLITKIETTATEDLDIPIEPIITMDGEECFVMIVSGRQMEDLLYDDDFRTANTRVIRDADNPLTRRAKHRYSRTYIIEYPKCLQPLQNVTRAIFLGANALRFAKVEELEFFEDFADDARRRVAMSVGGSWGVAPRYLNGSRRNAIAVDTWTRT